MKKEIVPIWEKSNLTLEEAAAYSNIGVNKLREITNCENCDFVLWVGNKRLQWKESFCYGTIEMSRQRLFPDRKGV